MAGTETKNGLTLTDKGNLVESLWHAVDNAAGNLENIPALVCRVIKTGAWQKRVQDGEVFEHSRFIDFITAKPLSGCGWPPGKVEALIKGHSEVEELWEHVMKMPPGTRTDLVDNINEVEGRSTGTSRRYILSRLKREDPKLFKQVVDGKLSANAAAIKAGFRRKLTPFEQIQKLILKLTDKERRQLREML